eukprot:12896753-Prorocentrum_lima.AAC.1
MNNDTAKAYSKDALLNARAQTTCDKDLPENPVPHTIPAPPTAGGAETFTGGEVASTMGTPCT